MLHSLQARAVFMDGGTSVQIDLEAIWSLLWDVEVMALRYICSRSSCAIVQHTATRGSRDGKLQLRCAHAKRMRHRGMSALACNHTICPVTFGSGAHKPTVNMTPSSERRAAVAADSVQCLATNMGYAFH